MVSRPGSALRFVMDTETQKISITKVATDFQDPSGACIVGDVCTWPAVPAFGVLWRRMHPVVCMEKTSLALTPSFLPIPCMPRCDPPLPHYFLFYGIFSVLSACSVTGVSV